MKCTYNKKNTHLKILYYASINKSTPSIINPAHEMKIYSQK